MNIHFSPQDLRRIEFEHFIFHIIVKDDDKPLHLDQVPLNKEQIEFFKERFKDAGKSATEYAFTDPESSIVVQQLQKLAGTPETEFLKISKELATSFHSYHRGNATDGIMIVALATLPPNENQEESEAPQSKRLILILKMDNQVVLRYKINRSENMVQAILEQVTNPIVQNKDALQKMAIIDVADFYEWDVLAFDRMTNTPRVGQYFENFLTMTMRETEVHLMETTVKAVRQWATINEEELDENQHITDYKERAIQYMETHDQFETEYFLDFVVQDEDSERRERLQFSLGDHLEQEGIAGRNYEPQPELLKSNQRRHEIRTAEGVKVQWTGTPEDNFIKITGPSKETEGLYEINIRTDKIDTLK